MCHLYGCFTSYNEDRPNINFEDEVNAAIDWLTVGEVLDGSLPREAFPQNIRITVDEPTATQWDFFMVGGTCGLFSQRFVDVVGLDSFADFSLFPVTLNGERYFFLRCEQAVDCLDRKRSIFTTFRSDPARIKQIIHYEFHVDRVARYVFFCIPESPKLIATEYVVEIIKKSDLRGVQTPPLP